MSSEVPTETQTQQPFLDRTWERIRTLWRDLASPTTRLDDPEEAQFSWEDEASLRRLMRAAVDTQLSEVAARARVAELGYIYLDFDMAGRRRFLELLCETLDLDRKRLMEATTRFVEMGEAEDYRRLQQAATPPRVRFLKMLNSLPEGFKFLVDVRKDLLGFVREQPGLKELDHDLKTLFDLWFDVSLLTFERITWDSPASLLEKLIEYEAVHEIRSWLDMKNRLEADRRCYAFFHPKIPGEPLIFVQVALAEEVPGNIQQLLDEGAPEQDPTQASVATFYSISNTQRGLAGISFGHFLLEQVIEDLSAQLPRLKTFVTLSPVPRFRRWLLERFEAGEEEAFLSTSEQNKLRELAEARGLSGLQEMLEQPHWWDDVKLRDALHDPLVRLCAYYLTQVKRSDGKPLDPVARFHLHNGAQLERVHYLADTSNEGMKQSYGVMVNYQYRPDQLELNHERLVQEGVVASAPAVRKLIKGLPVPEQLP